MLAHNADARASPTIAVTGASGFVGSALARALSARGVSVRAIVRRPGDADRLGAGRIAAVVVPDIAARVDWSAALAGVDAVVHTAGVAHRRATAADYLDVNVRATEALALAAARCGARLVFLSSAKVNGERTPGAAFREEDPPAPEDDYARSKAEAEARLAAVAGERGLDAVVLRLPLVYGPQVKANFLALLRLVDSGIPLPLAGIRNRRSLAYVGNVVDAVAACVTRPAARGQTFFVADETAPSTPELVRALAAGLGREARLFAVPRALLGAAAALAGGRARIAALYESLELDTTRIRSALAWAPPYSFAQGIAETCRWFAAARG